MTLPETQICLRQGVGCKCEFCLPWLARWEKELVDFTLFDTLEEEGKSLLFTYERLRAEHADLLRTHHEYFERKCIEHKIRNRKLATSPPTPSPDPT